MMTTIRRATILVALEAACVGILFVAPGNGHSEVWMTQFPALVFVAHVAPSAGSCFECAPHAWAVGIALQTLLLILAAILWPFVDPWRAPRGGSAS